MDYSDKQLTLKKITLGLIDKGTPLQQIADWVFTQDQLQHDEPVFKNQKLAVKFVLDIAGQDGDDQYDEYREFFDEHLKQAKRDIISGRMLQFDGQQWQSVLLRLDAIKSYALGAGLKPHHVNIHIDRYINKKHLELLVDIPKWDGEDRIAKLRGYVKIKNQSFEIFEDALKEWGANIFRRLYDDGAQNRCIILKGGQGIGKDYLLKSLFKSFGPYYAKFSSNRDEREAWSQVTSRLVLHVEEFDQTGQLSVAFLKDMITRDWVTYRSPYDRDAATKKCYGSFISTVNIDAILRDETGNRRFAVFDIESISWTYPKDWSDQILAQFHALYRADYWAKPETWAAVTKGNKNFEQVDMVPELLDMWDKSVAALYKREQTLGIKELTFGEVEGVISDMAKHSGWRSKAICSMLKMNNRSAHRERGTVYWSSMIKI